MSYSLIARCPDSGQLGFITVTKFLSAGAFMVLAEPSVGICISKGFLNPLLRHQVIDDLKNKTDIATSVNLRLRADSFPALRQLIAMDWNGNTAVHSGDGCQEVSHFLQKPGIIAAGNMLQSKEIIEEMVDGFCQANGSLAERLLIALKRGQLAGGDVRGVQSAALAVYGNEPYPVMDLRVDSADKPAEEILRLAAIHFASYAPIIARLPTLQNPAGILGPGQRKRLRHLASVLTEQGEAVPESWETGIPSP